MDALGINVGPVERGGPNKCHKVEHWDPTKKDGHGVNIIAHNQVYEAEGNYYRVSF